MRQGLPSPGWGLSTGYEDDAAETQVGESQLEDGAVEVEVPS